MTIDPPQMFEDYERDGVVLSRQFLSAVRAELARHIRDDLASKPADAATMEADGKTVRNLWRFLSPPSPCR